MEQGTELGLCKYVILWVDDHIFDDWWENKEHMERASTLGTGINVHFIPKSNTNAALTFLRSEFGQRLKENNTFRIVTDMTRINEIPSHNAGARLIKKLRQLGFINQCLVFIMNKDNAESIINSELNLNERKYVQITNRTSELTTFVNFEE